MRDPGAKILTLKQAIAWRKRLRGTGSTLAVTNGCFDILHRGHCDLLYRADRRGDALLVLLNGDDSVRALKGPERPVNAARDRAYVLASMRAVDAVVVFNSPRCDRELLALEPDAYVKAGDYSLETLDAGEREALIKVGASIEFVPLTAGHSTTAILDRATLQDAEWDTPPPAVSPDVEG